jgi:hypothetical protein
MMVRHFALLSAGFAHHESVIDEVWLGSKANFKNQKSTIVNRYSPCESCGKSIMLTSESDGSYHILDVFHCLKATVQPDHRKASL